MSLIVKSVNQSTKFFIAHFVFVSVFFGTWRFPSSSISSAVVVLKRSLGFFRESDNLFFLPGGAFSMSLEDIYCTDQTRNELTTQEPTAKKGETEKATRAHALTPTHVLDISTGHVRTYKLGLIMKYTGYITCTRDVSDL